MEIVPNKALSGSLSLALSLSLPPTRAMQRLSPGRTRDNPVMDSDIVPNNLKSLSLPLSRSLSYPGGTVCVSLFYVNDIGSTGPRGRTVGVPCVYPFALTLTLAMPSYL